MAPVTAWPSSRTALKDQLASEAAPIIVEIWRSKKKTIRTTQKCRQDVIPRIVSAKARLLTSAPFDMASHKREEYPHSQLHLHPPMPTDTQDRNTSCRPYLRLGGKLKQPTRHKGSKDATVRDDPNRPLLTRLHLHRPINLTHLHIRSWRANRDWQNQSIQVRDQNLHRRSTWLLNRRGWHLSRPWWRDLLTRPVERVCGRSGVHVGGLSGGFY